MSRYELLLPLGRGGMAELFLGRLRGAGGFSKLVAIKRILPHLAEERQFTEMFKNEGRIAARLSHPNVCQVFELDEIDGELLLVMEYLDGASWEHLCDAAPRDALLPLIAGVLAQAAEGLHYAHTLRDATGYPSPVVHRDVSPQNLFVTVDGVCKVLDFGVAKLLLAESVTRSGVLKGKLPYMAPEQILGEPVDARADIFSLAVCAWEALAGARLFDRASDYEIWKAIVEEPVPPIASRWPACPPLLDAVVLRALSRDPTDRQSTARSFAAELRNAAGSAADPPQIAAVLRLACADRLAARARAVAAATTGALPAGDAPPAGSVEMRRASIPVRAPATVAPPRHGRASVFILAAVAFAALVVIVTVIFLATRPGDPPPPPPAAPARANPGSLGDRLHEVRRTLLEVRDRLAPTPHDASPAE